MVQVISLSTSLRVSTQEAESFTDFSSEIFLNEENLLFFHVCLKAARQLSPFLKRKVTLSSIEEEKVGYLRKPTEKERHLFIERKLGEMLSSNVRMGQVLVFIPKEAA